MSSIGWLLPIIIVFFATIAIILGLIEKLLQPKATYQKWLKEELEGNPDYINWLKNANNGRDYESGLKILGKIERDKNNSYKRWLKRVRGKW